MTTHFQFGEKSRARLSTCAPKLAVTVARALELSPFDFTVVWGFRDQTRQDDMWRSGASQKRWPDSKHNHTVNGVPFSLAVDLAPWIDGAIPWKDTNLFCVLAGVMFAAAKERGVEIRWGGDWDGDGSTADQTLMDFGHFELVK